ncbi:MAG: hypothetical protein R8K46_00075 [Mariprofundaceae bacterium]
MKGKMAHYALRQFVLALLLLSSALPSIQTVFACDLMEGIQLVCCCEGQDAMGCDMGGGGCDTKDAIPVSGCCEVTYVYQPVIDAVALPGLLAFQLLTLDAPQPPPALLSSLFSNDLGISLQTGPYLHPSPPWRLGTKIHLLTSRLRI